MKGSWLGVPLLAGGFAAVALSAAMAQGWQTSLDKPARPAPTPPPAVRPVKAVAPAAAAPKVVTTTTPQALYLVRSTLLSLADANRSGNYTVLRDLASPAFAERNTAADLAQTFMAIRAAKIDLAAAAVIEPVLEGPPLLQDGQRLRLKGVVPTKPQLILFDLAFEAVAGNWRLHALSVAARPVEVAK